MAAAEATPPHDARVTVAIRRLAHAHDLPLPKAATQDSAGVDLRAAVDGPVTLAPGERAKIPTGLALALPTGYEGQVRPRSGLAIRHGITLLNSPGTIDADYRGEIAVLLINHGQTPFDVIRGMRIAQLLVAPVTRVAWQEVEILETSDRGAGGFGSTGTG